MSNLNFTSKYDPTNSNHIYYDLSAINNSIENTWQRCEFSDTRTSPFINCPNDYYCSVVRFEAITPTLPVFIPKIKTGQPLINLTDYQITMTYGAIAPGSPSYTVNLLYVPSDENLAFTQPPKPPLDVQDVTPYYYTSDIANFLLMVNQGLADCFAGLMLAIGTNWIYNPYIDFDPVTGLFKLIAPCDPFDHGPYKSYFGTNQVVTIFFNAALYELFAGLPAVRQIYPLLFPEINDYQILTTWTPSNSLVTSIAPPITLPAYTITVAYLTSIQENSSLAILNPIASFVFVSNSLSVLPGMTSPANQIMSNVTPQNNVGALNNSNVSNILTDFIVPFGPENNYKNSINYTPVGEYRLIDLLGIAPLNTLNISVFWKDKFGNLNQFYLANGASISLKLLFRRKDFNGPI